LKGYAKELNKYQQESDKINEEYNEIFKQRKIELEHSYKGLDAIKPVGDSEYKETNM
jgi:hypothetical protein